MEKDGEFFLSLSLSFFQRREAKKIITRRSKNRHFEELDWSFGRIMTVITLRTGLYMDFV